jgi:hypothetical protein
MDGATRLRTFAAFRNLCVGHRGPIFTGKPRFIWTVIRVVSLAGCMGKVSKLFPQTEDFFH